MNSHALDTTTYADGGLLRFALTLDGVVSGAMGFALLAGSAALDGPLGLPVGLLVAVGAFLTVYGAFVLRLARHPLRSAVAAVIAANVAWAAGALIALALDWHEPKLAGEVVIAVQVVGCAGFAALQYVGLRRS